MLFSLGLFDHMRRDANGCEKLHEKKLRGQVGRPECQEAQDPEATNRWRFVGKKGMH